MIGRIAVIARATFREAVRSRVFLNLLVLLVLLLLGGVVVDAGAIGDTGRIFNNLAHAAISIGGSMVALFVGVNLIAADIERKTLHVVLSRPVSRMEVVAGKFLGLAGVLAVNTLVAVVAYSFTAGVAVGQWTILSAAGVIAVTVLYLEFLVVGAVAMMFSTLSGTTTAAIFSLLVFLLGRLGEQLSGLAERSSTSGYGAVAAVFRVVIPDLTRFDLNPNAPLPTAGQLGLLVLYAGLWCAGLLALGTLIFRGRDLK